MVDPEAIWIVDPFDLTRERYMTLEPDIDRVMIAPNAERIYLLDYSDDRIPASSLKLYIVDTETGARQLLTEMDGNAGVHLSPDGNRALVVKPLDLEEFGPTGPGTFCILKMEKGGECVESRLPIYGQIHWVDGDTVVYLEFNQSTISAYNIHTGEITTLHDDFDVLWITVDQPRHELLVAQKRSFYDRIELVTIDLDTSVVEQVPHINFCPIAVIQILVSPNQEYMTFICYDSTTVLINNQTGEDIATFENLVEYVWVNDQLMIGTEIYAAGKMQLVKIQASTGAIIQSTPIPQRSTLMTVP